MNLNWHPKVTRRLDNGKHLTAHVALYSLHTPQLAVDVGLATSASDSARPIISERVFLDFGAQAIRTDEDIVAALDLAIDMVAAKVTWVACVRCGEQRLDTTDSNRFVHRDWDPAFKCKSKGDDFAAYMREVCDRTQPLCEACFLAAWEKNYKREADAKAARKRDEERKLLAEGYTHEVSAWVHPRSGDDYQVSWYSVGPMTERQIHGLLRRRGSVRLDDWTQGPIAGRLS